MLMVGTGYTDAASWFEVLKQHPEAAAIVSFVGLPNNISRKALDKLPPMYLGRRGQVPIASEELIRLESVRAIVDFRMPNTPPQVGAEDLREIFTTKYYLLQG